MTSDIGTQGEGSGSAALLRRTPDALESPRRWLLLWRLYGLPRCSQATYPADDSVEACHSLIWPWQSREVRNGSPVHARCVASPARPAMDPERLARALLTAHEEAIWLGWGSTPEVDGAVDIARRVLAD